MDTLPNVQTATLVKITRVRIEEQLYDLTLHVEDGVIESIVPSGGVASSKSSQTLDAGGLLYLPTMKDHHLHLDKHFLGEPWKSLQPFHNLVEQLAFEKKLLSQTSTTAGEKAIRLIELLLHQGTTAIRTHVDVDPDIGLSHLERILEVREQYRGRMDIEIVAFPQQGLLRSNSVSLMKNALRAGADLVGGVDPAGLDRQVDRSLEAMFELSAEFNSGVDLHLHDPGHLGLYTIERFAELTKQAGKEGRTVVSHAYSLGEVSEDASLQLAHKLNDAGVGIHTSVPIDHEMPRIDQLLQAGVKVGVGCDNILDAWSPFGNGDLLARASRLAEKFKWRTDDELMRVYPLISSGALVPKVGDRADFMLVNAMNAMHAVAAAPKREAVFSGGKLVGGEWLTK